MARGHQKEQSRVKNQKKQQAASKSKGEVTYTKLSILTDNIYSQTTNLSCLNLK